MRRRRTNRERDHERHTAKATDGTRDGRMALVLDLVAARDWLDACDWLDGARDWQALVIGLVLVIGWMALVIGLHS